MPNAKSTEIYNTEVFWNEFQVKLLMHIRQMHVRPLYYEQNFLRE